MGGHAKIENGHLDDSYLVFVKWLIARTKEQNLKWDSGLNLLTAQLRSMVVEFKTFDNKPEWSLFTVRDGYAELMSVSPLVLDKSPLVVALDRLFESVIKSEHGGGLSAFWHRFMPVLGRLPVNPDLHR